MQTASAAARAPARVIVVSTFTVPLRSAAPFVTGAMPDRVILRVHRVRENSETLPRCDPPQRRLKVLGIFLPGRPAGTDEDRRHAYGAMTTADPHAAQRNQIP